MQTSRWDYRQMNKSLNYITLFMLEVFKKKQKNKTTKQQNALLLK